MSLTDRDRKVILVLLPLLVLGMYWFLLMAPKREALSAATTKVNEAQQRHDAATAKLAHLTAVRSRFASDYATLVRLGKAVPDSVDMPSLIVQIGRAASSSGMQLGDITLADAETGGSSGGTASQPAQGPPGAGAQPAQSGPGQAAQTGANGVNNANSAQAGREAQTSQPGGGGLPVGGGAVAPAGAGSAGPAAAGLDSVGISLTFSGSFFEIAELFHRLKRFVRVVNDRILVRGRLLTVDSFKLTPAGESFPEMSVEVSATAYLSPRAQGIAAGATPSGPAQASAPGAAPPSAAPPAAPAATVAR